MAVSTYTNNQCGYNIDKLERVVYLINESEASQIRIDNDQAYVDAELAPMSLAVTSLQLKDEDELDERYKFTHTITFSMNGYVNYKDFEDRYYVVVKSTDGVYWFLNPFFPCKATYTYTLSSEGSKTDFTLATVSNHPMMKLNGFSSSTPYECAYNYCSFEELRLNEQLYSFAASNHVIYTNDGFKDIVYNKNSASLTEQYDGKNIYHTLNFSIKFDHYKSSWHYNLLEFVTNKYSAIIKTSCNNFILVGYNFGLQPAYTVTADDEMTMDKIEISLTDVYDNGSFIECYDEITVANDDEILWVNTSNYGYECVGDGVAKYLLKAGFDALMNPINQYKVLEGYEEDERFSSLDITGTFSTVETFQSNDCIVSCDLTTSLPLSLVYTSVTCSTYSITCSDNWSITSSSPHITVTPSNGVANQTYSVEVCNTLAPTNTQVTSYLTIDYCNKSVEYPVYVRNNYGCFPSGYNFSIQANEQNLIIPISCAFTSVTESTNTVTIENKTSYIIAHVPSNNFNIPLTYYLTVEFRDGSVGQITITQSNGYERWVKETTVCNQGMKCDVERKYTGITASDVNTITNETRIVNCMASHECGGVYTRWVDTNVTTCLNDTEYTVQLEEESYDNKETWTETGKKRLGAEVQGSSACEGLEYEYRWISTNNTVCVGVNKYFLYQREKRIENSGDAWEEVIPTEMSYDGDGTMSPILAEENSVDCGYVPEIEPMYKWEIMKYDYYCFECNVPQFRWSTTSTYCDGYDKYERQNRQISRDGENWVNLQGETQDIVAEYNSSECGYVSPYVFTWSDNTTEKTVTHDSTSESLIFGVITTNEGEYEGWDIYSKSSELGVRKMMSLDGRTNDIIVSLPQNTSSTNKIYTVVLTQENSGKAVVLYINQSNN